MICYLGENIAYAYNLPSDKTFPDPGWEYDSIEHLTDKEIFLYPKSKVINPKVIYIPAERNFVSVVPNLQNMQRMTIT